MTHFTPTTSSCVHPWTLPTPSSPRGHPSPNAPIAVGVARLDQRIHLVLVGGDLPPLESPLKLLAREAARAVLINFLEGLERFDAARLAPIRFPRLLYLQAKLVPLEAPVAI